MTSDPTLNKILAEVDMADAIEEIRDVQVKQAEFLDSLTHRLDESLDLLRTEIRILLSQSRAYPDTVAETLSKTVGQRMTDIEHAYSLLMESKDKRESQAEGITHKYSGELDVRE